MSSHPGSTWKLSRAVLFCTLIIFLKVCPKYGRMKFAECFKREIMAMKSFVSILQAKAKFTVDRHHGYIP